VNRPADGIILSEGSEQWASWIRTRKAFFQWFRDLLAADLALHIAMAHKHGRQVIAHMGHGRVVFLRKMPTIWMQCWKRK
jgi:hypothetical protein